MEEKKTLREAIISEAREYAEKIVASAEDYASNKAKETEFEIKTYEIDQMALADAEIADIESKNAAAERMEQRMASLAARVELIDATYARATAKLSALPSDELVAFFAVLVEKYGEKDDKVFVAADASFSADDLIKALKAKGLSTSVERGEFKGGGILISGKTFDRDFSFAAIAKTLRENTEAEVSAKLFD